METIQFTPSQVSDEMMKTIELYTESQDEFPVDFNQFWQWCGYTRKSNAKRVLEKNFSQLIDYQVLLKNEQNPKGGRPAQTILLSVECAKAFAMMAETSKGREVRKYFINCEKQLKAAYEKVLPRVEYLEELMFEMCVFKEEMMVEKGKAKKEENTLEKRMSYLPDITMYRTTTYPAYPNYRKALTDHIQRYTSLSQRSAQTLYNQLYRKFNDQYQIDLYAEVELEELTVIEWLEEKGLIRHAYVLATQIFRLDAHF